MLEVGPKLSALTWTTIVGMTCKTIFVFDSLSKGSCPVAVPGRRSRKRKINIRLNFNFADEPRGLALGASSTNKDTNKNMNKK